MATVSGGSGDDSLDGTTGDDSISGGAGDDLVTSQSGNDSIDGGPGNDTIIAASGQNTVAGGDGNDTIVGGDDGNLLSGDDGQDSVVGGAGADTLSGGAGSDTLYGNAGNDVLDGGADNDTVFAGIGADTVRGGTGGDEIYGEDGDDVLFGDDGADLIFGKAGSNTIVGGADNDTVYAGIGADTVRGGAGDDEIFGEDGDDLLFGDDGNDLIHGKAGSDTLVGGAGIDTVFGDGGADVFVANAGSGTVIIHDFTPAEGDLISVNYPGINTFAELQPYLGDDGDFGTLITFPDGSVTQIKWHSVGSVTSTQFVFNTGPVCLVKGTRIATPGGDRRIESLAPGQLVLTHDRGPQPVRRLVSHTYRFPGGAHKMKPLRIPPARFGANLPARELLLSPQHRIALPQTAPKRLVPARRLVDRFGLQQRHHCRIANYYNILMDRHEMIRANGLWVETLLLTRYSATRIGQGGRGAMRPARPIATA